MQELFDQGVQQEDQLQHLDAEKLMKACGRRDREMLTMFYVEGMTSGEIGKRVNKKPLTVRVRLHRIRKQLKSVFAPEAPAQELTSRT